MPPILSQIDFCILLYFIHIFLRNILLTLHYLYESPLRYSASILRIKGSAQRKQFPTCLLCKEGKICMKVSCIYLSNIRITHAQHLSIRILPENVQQTFFVWLLFSLQGNKCQIFIEGNRKPISVSRHLFN